MKKTLILGALLAGAIGANAQGTVNFADQLTGFTMHIYGPQASDLEVQGNAANDVPVGSTVYDAGSAIGGASTGAGLGNGFNVSVELYGAAGSGVALANLQPLSQYSGRGGSKPGAIGLFVGNAITGTDTGIPGTASGPATVALYAWFNGGGSFPTLASAQAGGEWGDSGAVTLATLGNANGTPPTTAPAIGVPSFSLVSSSPEPSTIALGVMGASAFLLRRRMSK
jgi:hypothetical protein